jgi:hypothetical protein
MASRNLAHSTEARTCGVATVRSGRPSAKPSDARSSSAAADAPELPTSAEPGSQGRPDRAGEARERAPRDPAEGWERARMVVSPLEVADNETQTGGEVSPPAKNQPNGQSSERDDSSTFSVTSATERDLAFGQGVRCVGKRVDALVVAFKVEVAGGVFDQISAQQALANEVGAAELALGDFRFALKRGRQSRVPFENADLRGIFDPLASGGFVLELTARASFLATRTLREAVALLMQVAAAFGVLRAFRLRRFDLAADYAGFVLSAGDVDRVLTTRARLLSFRADPKDFDEEEVHALREHRDSSLTVTGITVAAGNP